MTAPQTPFVHPVNVNREIKMANRFLGIKLKKSTSFMGLDLEVNKLSVTEVVKIQEEAKQFEESKDPMANLKMLISVIRFGAPELRELTDDELNEFPVDELTELANTIMEHSGLVPNATLSSPIPS